MGKFTDKFDHQLKAIDQAQYERQAYQSYMTAPEWRNVEIAEGLARFINEKNSFFHFPYFKQARDIWSVFFKSYAAARKYNSAWAILTSEYMVMDLFVAIFTTMDMLPKSFISTLLYPFLSAKNDTQMQQHLADYLSCYAKELETQPWFDHDFKTHRQALAQKYRACTDRTWTDWFTWSMVSMDLLTKQWLAYPLRTPATITEENNIPATTDMIVKFNLATPEGELSASQSFKHALERAVGQFKQTLHDKNIPLTKEDDIHVIQDQIYTKQTPSKQGYTSVYARISAPRYLDFRTAVDALANEGIVVRKIAGRDHVQVKCQVSALDEQGLSKACYQLNQTQDAHPLYSYNDPVAHNRRYCLFDVPVKQMHQTLRQLEAPITDNAQTNVQFIHNF